MTTTRNFLPDQYQQTGRYPVNHNYLQQQFADYEAIFEEMRRVVRDGDFTLGKAVNEFEDRFARLVGVKYAVGVGSGTDALFLSLKALGIGAGDEVITTPYTFFATVGAIVTAGARPVFVDIGNDYNIDPTLIERAVTGRTKAILPVHWSGNPCRMPEIVAVSRKHGLRVIEDACHAIQATRDGVPAGSFGDAGCFSMHPLKNLNVWGDGGVVATNSSTLYESLVLLRNHGLVNRSECRVFGYNSRLDTLQAVVALHLMRKLDDITAARIRNAAYFDRRLAEIDEITVPPRDPSAKQVYHLYIVRCQRRDELQRFLCANGVDAKVHYPIPMHLQPAAVSLGYREGDFPMCEAIVKSVLSLPVHEYITPAQQDHVVSLVKQFYS